MYSGSTLKGMRHFDAWFGVHQKIDRAARKHLGQLLTETNFPASKYIVRFEGLDGPDGIKRKAPGQDEPWHFYDPNDENDTELLGIIRGHYTQLVTALRENNQTRASFEAAWLAHAVVDGLTPAHHYPYEEELIRLRGGAGRESRNSPKDKLLIPADTFTDRLRKNWQMWGDKGLLATHIAFEIGIAVIIRPLRLKRAIPTGHDLTQLRRLGLEKLFIVRAHTVDELKIYQSFYKAGWTPKLIKTIRRQLVPTIVNTVTLVWYEAAKEAAL